MQYKNLLLFCSFFSLRSEVIDKLFCGTTASIGRINFCYKDVFRSNIMLIGGVDPSLNFYFGVGYYNNFEVGFWPVEFKGSVYFLDRKNRELSSYYVKKIPITLSCSTQIHGLNIGGSISYSLNKKYLLGIFVTFRASDYLDVDVHCHAKGESDFFAKYVQDRDKTQEFKEDNMLIVRYFEMYKNNPNKFFNQMERKDPEVYNLFKKLQRSEVVENIFDVIIEHAKNSIKLADHFLEKEDLNNKELRECEKAHSLFILGRSGSGKTFLAQEFLEEFAKAKKIKSIAFMHLTAIHFTPQGYIGEKANKNIESAIEKLIKEGYSSLAISRAFVMIDEIDSIAGGSRNQDDFYSKVQKEILEFVEGKSFYNTSIGEISLIGALKVLPGAFERSAGEINNLAYKNVFQDIDEIFSGSAQGLSNYIRSHHIDLFDELRRDLNNLSSYCEDFGSEFKSVVMKDPIMQSLAYESGSEIIKKLINNPQVCNSWKNENELKKLAKRVEDQGKKIKDILMKDERIDFKGKFDDSYCRFLIGLSGEDDYGLKGLVFNLFDDQDSGNRFIHYFKIASEEHKKFNALDYIVRAGMGREITRRSADVFYLSEPSFIKAERFLKKELDEYLKDNEVSFYEHDNDYTKFYHSILKFTGDLNSYYTYKSLYTLISRVKADVEYFKQKKIRIVITKTGKRYWVDEEISEDKASLKAEESA